jgi:sugar phosphate isomerase/epimerase
LWKLGHRVELNPNATSNLAPPNRTRHLEPGTRNRRLLLSLNPYGLAYSVGLQAAGTRRANPNPIGLKGFIRIVRESGLGAIELDHRWLTSLNDPELAGLRQELQGLQPICSFWLSQEPGETLEQAVRCCTGVGARILRFHLTPVLEGRRACWGQRWPEMLAHARDTLTRESSRVADAGLTLAIENHQDLGSEELVEIAVSLGPHAGICFDTGNPFAVGEDPVAFARRAADHIRHVHLKDYVAQFTNEGYRLVRCAIGDGAVPFTEIATVLRERATPLVASIEPGALESRHIRLFTPEWWNGYPPRTAIELGVMLDRLRGSMLRDDADSRTPWETGEDGDALVEYEIAQVRRSVANVRGMGICTG